MAMEGSTITSEIEIERNHRNCVMVVVCHDDGRCALNRDSEGKEVVPLIDMTPQRRSYSQHIVELSWEADAAWSLRVNRVLIKCARLKMLMAWCSTMGGAYSALGDTFTAHAENAGRISQYQLALADQLGDPLLAARCKLYTAFSLLQRGKPRHAAKIIKAQYQYATNESMVTDNQLIAMCLSCWHRLQHTPLTPCTPHKYNGAENMTPLTLCTPHIEPDVPDIQEVND